VALRKSGSALLSLALLWPFLIRTELRTSPSRSVAPIREAPAWQVFASRYGLAPRLRPGPVTLDGSVDAAGRRLFHNQGDPDSLFTMGQVRRGRVSVSAAFEMNDVVNRVVAPQPGVGDDRPRSAGDWQPVDRLGNPRQLRFGARIAF